MIKIFGALLISLAAIVPASAQTMFLPKANVQWLYDDVKTYGTIVTTLEKYIGGQFNVEETRVRKYWVGNESTCPGTMSISIQSDSEILIVEGECILPIVFDGQHLRIKGKVRIEIDLETAAVVSILEFPDLYKENAARIYTADEEFAALLSDVFAQLVRNKCIVSPRTPSCKK